MTHDSAYLSDTAPSRPSAPAPLRLDIFRRCCIGVYKCYVCRKQFTVKIGTVFEASNLPLHKWLQAVYLMCSSKKGVGSNQLGRTLGIQVRSAWFLSHRIRDAMRTGSLPP